MPQVNNSPIEEKQDEMLAEAQPLAKNHPLVPHFAKKKTRAVPPKKNFLEHGQLLNPLVGNESRDGKTDELDMLLDKALAKGAPSSRSSKSKEAGQKGIKSDASQEVKEAHRIVQFYKPTHPAQLRVARLMNIVDKATEPDAPDNGAAARRQREQSGQIPFGSSNQDYQWSSPQAQAKVDKIIGAFNMPLCGAENCLLHPAARRAPEKTHQTNLRQEVWLQALSKKKDVAPLVKNPAPRRAPTQVEMIRSELREMQSSHKAAREWKSAIQARVTRMENDMAAVQMWQDIMNKGVSEVMEAVFDVTKQMTQLAQYCAARSEHNQTLRNQTLSEPKQEESEENKENTPPFGANSARTV